MCFKSLVWTCSVCPFTLFVITLLSCFFFYNFFGLIIITLVAILCSRMLLCVLCYMIHSVSLLIGGYLFIGGILSVIVFFSSFSWNPGGLRIFIFFFVGLFFSFFCLLVFRFFSGDLGALGFLSISSVFFIFCLFFIFFVLVLVKVFFGRWKGTMRFFFYHMKLC